MLWIRIWVTASISSVVYSPSIPIDKSTIEIFKQFLWRLEYEDILYLDLFSFMSNLQAGYRISWNRLRN